METITLYTKDGEPVTDVKVPPMTPPAEILLWGERYFVWNNTDQKYYEGLCFWIPPDHPLTK